MLNRDSSVSWRPYIFHKSPFRLSLANGAWQWSEMKHGTRLMVVETKNGIWITFSPVLFHFLANFTMSLVTNRGSLSPFYLPTHLWLFGNNKLPIAWQVRHNFASLYLLFLYIGIRWFGVHEMFSIFMRSLLPADLMWPHGIITNLVNNSSNKNSVNPNHSFPTAYNIPRSGLWSILGCPVEKLAGSEGFIPAKVPFKRHDVDYLAADRLVVGFISPLAHRFHGVGHLDECEGLWADDNRTINLTFCKMPSWPSGIEDWMGRVFSVRNQEQNWGIAYMKSWVPEKRQ